MGLIDGTFLKALLGEFGEAVNNKELGLGSRT